MVRRDSGAQRDSTRISLVVSMTMLPAFAAGFVVSVPLLMLVNSDRFSWLSVAGFLLLVVCAPVVIATLFHHARQLAFRAIVVGYVRVERIAKKHPALAQRVRSSARRAATCATSSVRGAIGIAERWGWRFVWFVGGPIALGIAFSSTFRGWPQFSQRAMLPSLYLYGSLGFAGLLTLADASLAEWAVDNREPQDSLHPGQIWFTVLALLGLGAVIVSSLVLVFFATLGVLDALDTRSHPTLRSVLPWGSGALCVLWALWSAIVPIYAMLRWFASRRALEKMRTEALLRIADREPALKLGV